MPKLELLTAGNILEALDFRYVTAEFGQFRSSNFLSGSIWQHLVYMTGMIRKFASAMHPILHPFNMTVAPENLPGKIPSDYRDKAQRPCVRAASASGLSQPPR